MVRDNVVFFHSFVLGIGLSVIYDHFRIHRMVFRHSRIKIYLEDLWFWMIALGASLVFLYYENNGCLRWFMIIGGLLGVILYEKTLGKIVIKVSVSILRKIKNVLNFLKKSLKRRLKNLKELIRINLKCALVREESTDEQNKEKESSLQKE